MDGIERCRIYIDDKEALSASIEWTKRGTSLLEVAAQPHGVEPGDQLSKDGRYIYSKTGAAGKVTCSNPIKEDSTLFTAIRISGASTPDESAMLELIRGYSEGVAASTKC
ncbi:hypothetical protein [Streptomyces sp. A5-4]|uniref:hypothetical protein n=1 Tax=Streptomyces sp. A5-4 TaxID=3384771 RepID=UPI003DA9156B